MIVDEVLDYLNKNSKINTNFINQIKNSVSVKVQNIADYLYMINTKEIWDFKSDFTGIAPTWENFTIEWKNPPYSISDEEGRNVLEKCRTLSIISDVTKNDINKIPPSDSLYIKTKFILNFTHFMYLEKVGYLEMIGTSIWFIDNYGNIIMQQLKEGKALMPKALNKDAFNNIILTDEQKSLLLKELCETGDRMCLLTIKFANCKNIVHRENNLDEGIIHQRKRKNKFPITKYYTLEIDGKTKDKVNLENKGLWTNSLHICRGHFKNYTSDAPLFGHYVGTVWCPMHTKGTEYSGKVIKDYKI